MFIYYVYAYINKKTGLPYYIGKGKGDRAFKKHKPISTPKDKSKIIFLETNLSEIGAFALERRYIRWYGRKDIESGILLNKTDGGEGSSGIIPWNKNGVHTEETKKAISENRKGKMTGSKNHRYGKSGWNKDKKLGEYSEIRRKAISKSLKGKPTWNKGKKIGGEAAKKGWETRRKNLST